MADSQNNVTDILASYRQWKAEGEALRSRAQSCLLERFSALVREAQQVQHDLWEDFGHAVKFPANPKFARKGKGRPGARKGSQTGGVSAPASSAIARNTTAAGPAELAPKEAAPVSRSSTPSARNSSAQVSLRAPKAAPAAEANTARQRRHLAKQIQKAEARLEQVRALGDPVKLQNAEDRLYELNDELRLLDAGE